MDLQYPIIWTEGALLSQQHFQYWESWLLKQQSQILISLFPDNEGLAVCEFELEEITQGKFKVKTLLLRLKNGSWLEYQQAKMPALFVSLEDCAQQIVYLNLSHNALCSGLSGYEANQDACAFQAVYQELEDRYDARRRQELTLGQAQFRLSTSSGDSRLYESWPLAKITRQTNGQFEIAQDYLPLSLTLKGSPQLQTQLCKLIENMSDKLRFLDREHQRTKCEKRSRELSLIACAHFDLKEVMSHQTTQPRQIYALLAKTLIQLDPGYQPEAYVHGESGEALIKICKALNARLVEKVESLQSYIMQKSNQHYPCLTSIEPVHLQGHHWYLGVDFSHQPAENIQKFLNSAKLATFSTLEQIIASALPGIPFNHISRPPNRINILEGYEYFKLDHESVFWKQVKEERSLMLSIPGFLDGEKITLDLVKE